MKNKVFECKEVAFFDYAQELGILRRKVWELEDDFDADAFPDKVWIDDFDTDAIHLAVFDKGKIIASARVSVYYKYDDIPYIKMMEKYKSLLKLPVASFNRLVVDNNYRGNGLAAILDKERIERMRKIGAKTIVGQAVPCRIEALKDIGFEYIAVLGSYAVLPKVELSLMIYRL